VFVEAIEIVAKYTRPIHSISRTYGSTVVQPGTATLFFVNSDGWALTCGHVIDILIAGEQLATKAQAYKEELNKSGRTIKKGKLLNELRKQHGYSKGKIYELHNNFINCIEGELKFKCVKHKKHDVALIKFDAFSKLLCGEFPVFPSDTSTLQRGRILCRLGFPFPEFKNFRYDEDKDILEWTDTEKKNTPLFPSEGMVTRFVSDNQGNRFAFELSTPGLRGQSGGPAFDTEGKVWGMQFQTVHLDLNFDVDQEVLRKGKKTHVKDSAFLHVGRCIHIEVLKTFMRENNVPFEER